MKQQLKKIGLILAAAGLVCVQTSGIPVEGPAPVKKVTAGKGGWVSLFDGKSLKGWHGFNKKGPVKNWTIVDGALVCLGAAQGDTGGDIVTDKSYANFELTWQWKIDKGSNSGVLYHVVEDPKYDATYVTGPEYQIIDDTGWPDKLEDWQKTGCDYAMHLPNDKKKIMPVGEWNTSKIVFNKGHVEHWLNGAKILEFTAWDADWQKKKAEGKWKDHPDYGNAKTGVIALQDHGHKAYFKDIKIREL
ncbi:3-keto-disaccharide hydrolase [Mucilaginibacter lappiensis]|uniref:3-keto-alpha-glucoside-1,2-lyase/3-keto-2-hydroxy-glucal hydratase domain-containing protein n=1 Tax=Mucilaginibacter lappiensis TaxID=354630 RepID=A0A841JAX3_9SPHI|nr:DUF1080 domain-containing protein [Mucilaginibacter lappiensis]MBB6128253.1 hypothetical protein [Mucilaginibacter lappiensis]